MPTPVDPCSPSHPTPAPAPRRSCELLLGVAARAAVWRVHPDGVEVSRLDWVPRARAAAALAAYDGGAPHGAARAASVAALGFYLPPPHTLAHMLLRGWARREGWWEALESGGALGAASTTPPEGAAAGDTNAREPREPRARM